MLFKISLICVCVVTLNMCQTRMVSCSTTSSVPTPTSAQATTLNTTGNENNNTDNGTKTIPGTTMAPEKNSAGITPVSTAAPNTVPSAANSSSVTDSGTDTTTVSSNSQNNGTHLPTSSSDNSSTYNVTGDLTTTLSPNNYSTTTEPVEENTTMQNNSSTSPNVTVPADTQNSTKNGTVTTLKPASTTVAETTNNESVSTSTLKPNESSTSQPVTEKPSTKTQTTKTANHSATPSTSTVNLPSSTHASERSDVFINEIKVDVNGFFSRIELKISTPVDLSRYAVVVVTEKQGRLSPEIVVYLNDTNFTSLKSSYMLFTFSEPKFGIQEGSGVAVYDTQKLWLDTDSVKAEGVIDALVIGSKYTNINSQLIQTLTPGVDPFVVKLSEWKHKSISRCSNKSVKDTRAFALLDESLGDDNSEGCSHIQDNNIVLELHVLGDCSNATNNVELDELIGRVIHETNNECLCGLTMLHVVSHEALCCSGLNLKMNITASGKDLIEKFESDFRKFIHGKETIEFMGKPHKLAKCSDNCCSQHDKSTDGKPNPTSKSEDVKVTVAVIVSCLLVFLIILVACLVYMKRKKRAVYQFRMSRLDEEDDDQLVMEGPEHDDFVGGQEATFDIK